jgi:hypothetical protein
MVSTWSGFFFLANLRSGFQGLCGYAGSADLVATISFLSRSRTFPFLLQRLFHQTFLGLSARHRASWLDVHELGGFYVFPFCRRSYHVLEFCFIFLLSFFWR